MDVRIIRERTEELSLHTQGNILYFSTHTKS